MKLDVIRLVRGKNGMRVEEVVQEVIGGGYWGDEVKGADIVCGGRARIIRKVFHEEDEDGIRRVTENEDIIWERFDRDDGGTCDSVLPDGIKIVLLEEELHGYQVPVIETCLWGESGPVKRFYLRIGKGFANRLSGWRKDFIIGE